LDNQTKEPAFIIYADGTTEQLTAVPIAFFEQAGRMFTEQAARLKTQVMIQPPGKENDNEE